MEPDQNGDQAVQSSSNKVRPSDRTDQTDRAVYRIDPRTSGVELRLEPRPDDWTDCTTDVLSRPTRQAKTDGQARINLEREESEDDRIFLLLAHLVRTAHPEDGTNNLASVFDPMMDFSLVHFSKARILKLSEDLTHVGTQLVREGYLADRPDRPSPVLILTAMESAGTDEPGQEANGHLDHFVNQEFSLCLSNF